MTPARTLPLAAPDYQRTVERAHDQLGDLCRADLSVLPAVRTEVAESWRRSLSAHIVPGVAEPRFLADDELRRVQREHPVAAVLPLIRSLLVEPATDAGLIVAVGNAQGHLLWVEGEPAAARRAETMGFVPGADWSEVSAGTSAPGLSLATGQPTQVARAEHFNPVVHPWSCSAVPLRDPITGALLGVIDLTGGDDAVSPLALPLLQATATAVQSTWQRQAASSTGAAAAVPGGSRHVMADAGRQVPDAGPRLLRVTGLLPPRLVDETSGSDQREVTGKHAEILTLLDWHAPGLDGPELTELLYGSGDGGGAGAQDVTLRAEMHRLRRALTCAEVSTRIESRPYRITGHLRTDAVAARQALRDGDLTAALEAALGPVLPRSEAPGVRRIRLELDGALREAVLQDADVEQLWQYLRRPEAAGDPELWMTALTMLPQDSPRRALAVSTLEGLAREER